MLVWSDFSRTLITSRLTDRMTCCPSLISSTLPSSISVIKPCIKSFNTPIEASLARNSMEKSWQKNNMVNKISGLNQPHHIMSACSSNSQTACFQWCSYTVWWYRSCPDGRQPCVCYKWAWVAWRWQWGTDQCVQTLLQLCPLAAAPHQSEDNISHRHQLHINLCIL